MPRELAALARDPGDFDASRYFRAAGHLRFYNTGTTAMRALARSIARAHAEDWTLADALSFADRLMVDPHLETKSVGIEVVARYRRSFTPRLLGHWKRWLGGGLSANWATTDAICGSLVGPVVAADPRLASIMRGWARHRSLWVRRAAAVGLIRSVNGGAALDVAYSVARILAADDEDLIQKAVGWMLREAGKADAARLERYLRGRGPTTPRTTVRYAIERFPPAKRRALLTTTRPATARSGGEAGWARKRSARRRSAAGR